METRKQKLKRLRKTFVLDCMRRDGCVCKICSSKEDLTVHHILSRKKIPNDGYAMENGITLCPKCHIDAELGRNGLIVNYLFNMIGSSESEATEESEKL